MVCTGALSISWLHPWQGETLVIVIPAVEGLRLCRTRSGPPRGLFLVFAAFALPALYYLALSTMDPVWSTYRKQNALVGRPWWPTVLALLPLAAPALLAYRLPARHWQEQAVRAWPFAAALVYVLPGRRVSLPRLRRCYTPPRDPGGAGRDEPMATADHHRRRRRRRAPHRAGDSRQPESACDESAIR
jgi:hypothetical protein